MAILHFQAQHLLVGIQCHCLYRVWHPRRQHADITPREHHSWPKRVGEVSEPLQDSLAITTDSEHPSGARSPHPQSQTAIERATNAIKPATPHGEHQDAYG